MFKVIVKMVLALVLLCYGALFLSWNMVAQEITTWQMFGVKYSQALPVGALVFIGLVAGFILMAVASWSAWSSQKALADRAVAQVKKAKEKLQAQLDLINDLRAQVEQQEQEIGGLRAGNGTWGQVLAGDVSVPPVPAETAVELAPGKPDEDPEVI